ncbi:hypothetical protein K8353_03680, partial [Burkholderia contaminans]|nr:hypothetical protein [Burkholderia contaminans]
VGDQPTGQNTTFLFSGNATSELGTYTQTIDNSRYVKCGQQLIHRTETICAGARSTRMSGPSLNI